MKEQERCVGSKGGEDRNGKGEMEKWEKGGKEERREGSSFGSVGFL